MDKKTAIFSILAVLAVLPAFAGETYRSAVLISSESEFSETAVPGGRTEDDGMFGFEAEYIPRNLGYGIDALAGFRSDSEDRSLLDWQGQLFLRYHLFGGHSFFDPYLETGIGNAGTVRISDGGGLKMSLYPFVSTGMNFVFKGGFYLGGRWSYRMDEWQIPGTSYPVNGTGRVQVSLMLGMSYSTDCCSCGKRHNHCR